MISNNRQRYYALVCHAMVIGLFLVQSSMALADLRKYVPSQRRPFGKNIRQHIPKALIFVGKAYLKFDKAQGIVQAPLYQAGLYAMRELAALSESHLRTKQNQVIIGHIDPTQSLPSTRRILHRQLMGQLKNQLIDKHQPGEVRLKQYRGYQKYEALSRQVLAMLQPEHFESLSSIIFQKPIGDSKNPLSVTTSQLGDDKLRLTVSRGNRSFVFDYNPSNTEIPSFSLDNLIPSLIDGYHIVNQIRLSGPLNPAVKQTIKWMAADDIKEVQPYLSLRHVNSYGIYPHFRHHLSQTISGLVNDLSVQGKITDADSRWMHKALPHFMRRLQPDQAELLTGILYSSSKRSPLRISFRQATEGPWNMAHGAVEIKLSSGNQSFSFYAPRSK